jgi:hypothetical protein
MLVRAIFAGNVLAVQRIIDNGTGVGETWGVMQSSAIQAAITMRDPDMAAMLVENGWDVNAKNRLGETALYYAARGSQFPYPNDARNPMGIILPGGLEEGFVQIAEMLIANRAYVSPTDTMGENPLHIAALMGRGEMVDLLLKNGVDLWTESPRSAWDLAKAKGYHKIAAKIAAEGPRRVLIAEEAVRRERIAQCEAFAMGHQKRLGAVSLVQGLPLEVVRMVTDLV